MEPIVQSLPQVEPMSVDKDGASPFPFEKLIPEMVIAVFDQLDIDTLLVIETVNKEWQTFVKSALVRITSLAITPDGRVPGKANLCKKNHNFVAARSVKQSISVKWVWKVIPILPNLVAFHYESNRIGPSGLLDIAKRLADSSKLKHLTLILDFTVSKGLIGVVKNKRLTCCTTQLKVDLPARSHGIAILNILIQDGKWVVNPHQPE